METIGLMVISVLGVANLLLLQCSITQFTKARRQQAELVALHKRLLLRRH